MTFKYSNPGNGGNIIMRRKIRFVFIVSLFLASLVVCISEGGAEITVYDNDGQYLGILITARSEGDESWVFIFVPSVNVFVRLINSPSSPKHCDAVVIPAWFESDDCTGIPYLKRDAPYTYRWVGKTCAGKYVTPGESKDITLKSYRMPDDCECIKIQDPEECKAIELVDPPPQPFDVPVSLPFRFEHSVLGVDKVVIGPPYDNTPSQ